MIRLDSISKQNGHQILFIEASAALNRGEKVGLVGPNGAGKSTLLRALAGLLIPASGEVTLDGRPLAHLARMERARRIAFLPQERTIHWPLAARSVVALGRLPHRGMATGESTADAAAIDAAISALDIGTIAQRPVNALSGGERARVLLARALAQEADILLADEPTASLDAAHQLALFELACRLARSGRTVAVAIHDLSLALRYASQTILMASGRVVVAGPTTNVMTPNRLRQAFGVEMVHGMVDGVPVVVPRAPVA